MKSKFLQETFRTIDLQRNEIKDQLRWIEKDLIWRNTEASEWSIGQWLEHLYKAIHLQRIGWSIYIPVATPIAFLFRKGAYTTSIENLFEKAPHKVPNPFWGIRSDKATMRELEQLFQMLKNEKEKLADLLDNYDESILGHIKFYEGPFGLVNILQGVELIAYHEKNDFRHINSILDCLS